VDTLALGVTHRLPDRAFEAPPQGVAKIANGTTHAFLLTPPAIDPARRYPLVTVLHGAGRQDELLCRGYRDEAAARDILILIPRSTDATWDLITGSDGPDLAFLARLYDEIYQRLPVDPARQALIGYSDGASYALALGLSNPRVFAAVMGWAAGFVAIDRNVIASDDPRPRILLEHGTHDTLFPFEQVCVPNVELLRRLGYEVELRVDQGGVHWPSAAFQTTALDWFLS
jgi:poly(3-hydroxybutyrate) depolymerase